MTVRMIVLTLVVLAAPMLAYSQDGSASNSPRPRFEPVPIVEVLDAVRRNDDRSFLIDHRVPPVIVIGQASLRDIDYNTLLIVLRNNDLAAVRVDDIVNVIPASIVRHYPLPVISAEDDSIHDEEWVTWIIQTENAPPESIVPIIRPIMPAAGHFAANPGSQSMLLVDRYGNAKRIVALIRQFDAATPPQN